MRYDAVEVHPMVENMDYIRHGTEDYVGNRLTHAADHDKPTAYSVFLHLVEGGTVTLCDCESEEAADTIATAIENTLSSALVQDLDLYF